MDRQGPRFRGGPPGQHGDGTNRLSDTEDSVVTRKRSLRSRHQEEDDQEDDQENGDAGSYWEPHPANDDDDDYDDGLNPVRPSGPRGPLGIRGAGSHNMDDKSLPPRGAGRGKGNGPPEMDSSRDSRDSDLPGGRARGRGVADLPFLIKDRAEFAERLRMLNRKSANEYDNWDIVCRIACMDRIIFIDEEIANFEGGQCESSKTPREMGPPTHKMDPDLHQSRAGGRGSFETRGELLDDTFFEMKGLKIQRESLKEILIEFYDSGELKGARREMARIVDKDLDHTNQAIARLELEQRQGGKTPRGTGQPLRRRDHEDYDDEESDHEPRGPRRSHPESAAGYR